jgi:four helix bundle protein
VTSNKEERKEGALQSHKDLNVWKMSMEFVSKIYRITRQLPNDEQYGLSSQMRRSAISIPCNIAEGAARHSSKEYMQFLYISLGSLAEIETQLDIAERLDFIAIPHDLSDNIVEIRKMLLGLIAYVAKKKRTPK